MLCNFWISILAQLKNYYLTHICEIFGDPVPDTMQLF